MSPLRVMTAAALVLVASGCGLVAGLSKDYRADPGSLDGGAVDGGEVDSGATSTGCPGDAGPRPVRVDDGYCIDSTEVTKADYAAFLGAAGGGLPRQPPACSGNELTPTSDWPPTDGALP